jgi:hypothetical protein
LPLKLPPSCRVTTSSTELNCAVVRIANRARVVVMNFRPHKNWRLLHRVKETPPLPFALLEPLQRRR